MSKLRGDESGQVLILVIALLFFVALTVGAVVLVLGTSAVTTGRATNVASARGEATAGIDALVGQLKTHPSLLSTGEVATDPLVRHWIAFSPSGAVVPCPGEPEARAFASPPPTMPVTMAWPRRSSRPPRTSDAPARPCAPTQPSRRSSTAGLIWTICGLTHTKRSPRCFTRPVMGSLPFRNSATLGRPTTTASIPPFIVPAPRRIR